MQNLAWHIPMLNRVTSAQLLTAEELIQGLRNTSLCEVLERDNGENLTLYAGRDGFIYGQINYFDDSIEDIENWDEGFETEKILVPAVGYGYRFSSVDDARAFFNHIKIWFPDKAEPFGYVRLTPREKEDFILNKELTAISEQYKNHGDWQSLSLSDGRILLINPYRDDKAHVELYNNLDDYLIKKQEYEGFLNYLDNNP